MGVFEGSAVAAAMMSSWLSWADILSEVWRIVYSMWILSCGDMRL